VLNCLLTTTKYAVCPVSAGSTADVGDVSDSWCSVSAHALY
jgi:hypothetical protein